MDIPLKNQSATERRLTPVEILNLFVITLADVYTYKNSLLAQLPYLAGKVSSKELKLMIVNLGTTVNGQCIRLRLAITLLQKKEASTEIKGNLNLDKYLYGHLTPEPFENDAIILTHLILTETIEIASFELLASLSLNLNPKAVSELIQVSLHEAQESKRSLEMLLVRSYLSSSNTVN